MSEDFRISVSKSKTYKQCKLQYKFNYVSHFPKKDHDYLISGSFCHAVLEDFHKAYMNGSFLPYNDQMTASWKVAMVEFKPKMTPEIKKECWDIINKYLRKLAKNKLPNVLAVEKKFSLEIADNIFLNGAIDRVQLDDDNVVHVADYKTTKNKTYLKKDWLQLKTYGYILVSENPDIEVVRGSYILLRHDFEEITRGFSREELLGIKDEFVEYANDMMAETEFEPNPTVLCGWCDWLDICEKGKEKVASNQKQSHKVYGAVGY